MVIFMIFVASILLTIEFMVIDSNSNKMDRRLTGVKLGRILKS